MEVEVAFPPDGEAFELVEQGEGLLDDVAQLAQPLDSLGAALGDDRNYAPAGELADTVRGHWHVENQLHWVRDIVFDADRGQVRTGNSPHVMASLRSLAITVLRLTSTTNVAAALRHHARQPDRPLHALMTCRPRLCRRPPGLRGARRSSCP